ncbi:hypothetical protein OF83DRAFT_1140174 [Amylostereum chailletii]|nr:hypothetical protein OF83DRAFT_1140174 [Amylostereum chailletii]
MPAQIPIEQLSFQLRDIYLNVTLLESFMNGIYTAIMAVTFYTLIVKRNLRTVHKGLVAVMLVMYALATLHLAQRWNLVRTAFITNGDTAATVFSYMLHQPQWSIMVGATVVSANTLIADCVLIWRCYWVWDGDWKAIVLPVCTTIVGTVFSVFSLYKQAQPGAGLATDRAAFINSATIYFSLPLATTLLATILIVSRILWFSRRVGVGRYTNVIEIVVESAMLYSINLIVFLPLQSRDDFNDAYPQAILAQMTGIAPTLIVARVTLGFARPAGQWSTNPNHGVTTSASIAFDSGAIMEQQNVHLPDSDLMMGTKLEAGSSRSDIDSESKV